MNIAKRIAEARIKAGLSQSELARKLGIRPQSVQGGESGATAPRARRIAQISEVLGVPESFFFKPAGPESTHVEESETVMAARSLGHQLVRLAESETIGRNEIKVLREVLKLIAGRSDVSGNVGR